MLFYSYDEVAVYLNPKYADKHVNLPQTPAITRPTTNNPKWQHQQPTLIATRMDPIALYGNSPAVLPTRHQPIGNFVLARSVELIIET